MMHADATHRHRGRRAAIAALALLAVALTGCAHSLKGKKTEWVGAQRLEYLSQGEGSPTVVFNSNTDMDSWGTVLPEVAKLTRVFADSRPGHGGSKPQMGRNTGKRVVERLHALLSETGQRPPYVLVAHSYSGLFANLFARTYPAEVAGVVFVDASHPDQEDWWHKHLPVQSFIANVLAKETFNYEFFDFEVVAEDIRAAGPFPDVPVAVITAGKRWVLDTRSWREQWMVFQQELAALSPRGTQVVAENSGHVIQLQQPELIIDAIRQVVEGIRTTGATDSSRAPVLTE
ncbi:MAG: alpha/beta hydrolase [Candidatus Edwardsbacteria bacterium]|jgi:pimeloyl-ACP methyl ester carboxylesterase|nr:alpha/beta hydrolase [Candidatus Edwardsbacteria bacterium]